MGSSRNWVFTLNNPPEEGYDIFEELGGGSKVRFLAYQLEVGSEGHTPHYQGYVVLKSKVRLTAVKKLLPTAHWEVRRGTHAEAFEYVTKDDTRAEGAVPVVIGDPPDRQGARSDLVEVQKSLDSGASLADVAESHFAAFVRYHRGFQLYRQLRATVRSEHTYTSVFWGESGSGKSYRASFEAGAGAYYLPPPNQSTGAVWWDGYEGQEDVVIDEFYGWIAHNFMLRLCDRQPIMVQSKGGNVPFVAKRLFITSNKAPSEWWPRTGLGAMERRLREPLGRVIHMSLGPGGAHWRPPQLELPEGAPDPMEEPSDDEEGGPGHDFSQNGF